MKRHIYVVGFLTLVQAVLMGFQSSNENSMAQNALRANHWDASATHMVASAIYAATGAFLFLLGNIAIAVFIWMDKQSSS